MTAATFPLRDSATMFRRDLRRALRYPVMTISGLLTPVSMMLLFVFVFGGAISASLGGGSYVDYLAPAIIIMTVCTGSALTAVNVATDMNEGVIARFRTMAIFRPAVLVGLVAGSVLRTMLAVLLVLGVALLIGFRPEASPLAWLGALGLIALLAIGIQWVSVSIGLRAKSAGGANGGTMLIQFGAFISSAFVNTDTMPSAVAWIAENQPLTPIIETMRGLLLGTPIGNEWMLAIGWCLAIATYGYLRARAAFNRDPKRV
jgi:ABC-2 type transport system permease protein